MLSARASEPSSYTSLLTPSLRDEAQAIQSDVEDEERVYRQHHSALDHATPSQYTHARCQRPKPEHAVHGYPHDGPDM